MSTRIRTAVYRRIPASVYPWGMKKPLLLATLATVLFVPLAACHSDAVRDEPVAIAAGGQRPWFDGEYDNHEQSASAPGLSVPHVRFVITPLPQPGWYAWNVTQTGAGGLSTTWAISSFKSVNGSLSLTPYRALSKTPSLDQQFDPNQWVALDACTLRGAVVADGVEAKADLASCTTVAPGVGAAAALLPLSIQHDGESLRVRLYADQARGPDAQIVARKVKWYAGWAAINGAGPDARADSTDWHMNRGLRIDNEGGSANLQWRDGKSSGYSLALERVTYRDGNVPVLKLSVIENASGHAIAYSWANPEATRIGISLGWIQVGLESSTSLPVR